jgi:hypothetical protein
LAVGAAPARRLGVPPDTTLALVREALR